MLVEDWRTTAARAVTLLKLSELSKCRVLASIISVAVTAKHKNREIILEKLEGSKESVLTKQEMLYSPYVYPSLFGPQSQYFEKTMDRFQNTWHLFQLERKISSSSPTIRRGGMALNAERVSIPPNIRIGGVGLWQV